MVFEQPGPRRAVSLQSWGKAQFREGRHIFHGARRVRLQRDAHGIIKASASNVRHAATPRTVPTQIGTTFGFRYRLAGTPNGTPVNLREIVIFPPTGLVPKESSSPIVQDEFTLQSRIGEIDYAAYTLEDSFELVTGEWTIEIWYGDQKLGTQKFKISHLHGC